MNKKTKYVIEMLWWVIVAITMVYLGIVTVRAVMYSAVLTTYTAPRLSIENMSDKVSMLAASVVCTLLFGFAVMKLFELFFALTERKKRA